MPIVSKGQRFGGRAKGQRNKATVEREERARLAEEARQLEIAGERARAAKTKLAKEVLEEFMFLFAGMAAHHQPTAPGMRENPNADDAKFERYSEFVYDFASELAKYQSPTFKAIAVSMPPPPMVEANDPKLIEGKVVRMDDPVALAGVYRRLVTASRRR